MPFQGYARQDQGVCPVNEENNERCNCEKSKVSGEWLGQWQGQCVRRSWGLSIFLLTSLKNTRWLFGVTFLNLR